MRKKQPAPIVNLATLPVLLKITDMAAVYRISERTIRRLVERNEFHPIPYEKYPYRWRRDDVIRDLNGPSRKLRSAPHGFAKARQVDAGAELATK